MCHANRVTCARVMFVVPHMPSPATAASSSYTSESCGFVDAMQTDDSVSDGQSYSGNSGCEGHAGVLWEDVFVPRRDADLSLTGGGSQNNDNLYHSSAVYFIVDHDLLTPFDPGCVARTREIRFTATGWHDGYALDTIVPHVEDEDNAISDDHIFSVQSKRDIFVSNMPKNSKVKVGFSFVLTSIKTVIILLAAYLSVWNIDYHWVNSARDSEERKGYCILSKRMIPRRNETPVLYEKTRASPEISYSVKVSGKRRAEGWNLRDPLHRVLNQVRRVG